ncbi:hypothetical protein Z950_3765 [Sulfitobacter mediterraneus KCTC 32188]|nr:hypothetical protein Z950_3765 [Sulfitobacter mediterraneus KCTC 32188]
MTSRAGICDDQPMATLRSCLTLHRPYRQGTNKIKLCARPVSRI